MMAQAEYDQRMWEHVAILIGYDAGKAGFLKSDLDFSGVHRSFGGDLAFYMGKDVVFRMAVALGGGEGVHPSFGVADLLQ